MIRLLLVVIMMFTHDAYSSDGISELRRAKYQGAHAKVVLRCVDQDGNTVSNAHVSSGFTPDGSFERAVACNGSTDKNGLYAVIGKSNGELMYAITKGGYYRTQNQEFLYNHSDVFVCDGRWEPYGLTNTVILKRKVNPVAMYVADYKGTKYTLIPEVGKALGYDLMAGDWVAPNGKGEIRDFDITYIRDGKGTTYTNLALVISFPDPFSGYYKVASDTYSDFQSPYHADTNAVYEKEIRFNFQRAKRYIDGQLKADECLVLRTRPRIDKDGHLIGSHFGKIYGPLRFGVSYNAPGAMKMFHYFNPTENDTNLEFDPHNNLLFPGKTGTPP